MRYLSDTYARIGLPCLNCGEHSEQSIDWLRMHERLFCFACGVSIDLTKPENRAYIHAAVWSDARTH